MVCFSSHIGQRSNAGNVSLETFFEIMEFKLNVPKNLNSLDLEMVYLMIKQLKSWNLNPTSAPRVLLISGVGGKAFCAGGDIKLIYESGIGKADP